MRDTQGTTVEYQVEAWRATDTLDGVGEAPDGEQWVVVDMMIRTSVGESITIGSTQWAAEDFQGVRHAPDSEAMRNASEPGPDPLPERTEMDPNTRQSYRVYFSLQYTSDLTFVIEPYADSEGATIRIGA
jgi:hypothetical protein